MMSHRFQSALVVLVAAFAAASGVAAEAGSHASGARMFQVTLRRTDRPVIRIVAALAPQSTADLLAPDGTKVAWYSVDNAVRIAEAFDKAGLLDDPALAETIVGMVGAGNNVPNGEIPGKLDTEDFCLTMSMPDGGRIHIGAHAHGGGADPARAARAPEPGGRLLLNPEDGGRIVHWPIAQAILIKDAMMARGYGIEDVMKVWVGMKWSSPDAGRGGSDPSVETLSLSGRELDPPCGQCQNGIWNGRINACVQSSSRHNCTACTACGS